MDKWTAKVHVSGTRIQLLKNGSVTKVIKASTETFKPIEAKAFAENLVNTINAKQAKQMTDPDAAPAIDTKGEEQAKALKALGQDAKGISVKEASAITEENKSLKKKVARLEKEATIERKARRGLAIAKTMVQQKKIANDESAIKAEVMKIVAMSNDEIGLLEKKVAGAPLYNSADEAATAGRRYARMARLHRQAAEDAELAENTDLADDEDKQAAKYETLSKEAACEAEKCYAQMDAAKVDSTKPDDAVNQVKDEAKGVDAQGKKTASDDKDADDVDGDKDEEEEFIDDEKVASDDDDEDDVEEEEDEDFEIEAAAAIYRKIASDHTAKSEEFKKAGKETEAATELEVAKEAAELADDIESDEDEDEEDLSKEAAAIYRKIAAEHRKKADELEAEGKTPEADVEDEIADESEQLAASVESSLAKKADDDDSDSSDDDAKALKGDPMKMETEGKVAEDEGCKKVSDDDAKKPAPEVMPEDTAAVADTTDEVTDKEAKKTPATTDEDDPLAALLTDDEAKAASADEDESTEGDDATMPSDDEIDAAVAGDSDEDEVAPTEEEVDAGDSKEATTSKGSKKIANEGHSKQASYDRIEQNQYASDPQVRELESLWRPEENA
jgi:hypothetical protein